MDIFRAEDLVCYTNTLLTKIHKMLQLPSSFDTKHSAVSIGALQCEQLTSQRGLASGSSTGLQHPCSCH